MLTEKISNVFTKNIKGKCIYSTDAGVCLNDDSLNVMKSMKDNSVNLVLTSPPFALVHPKEYGNKCGDEFVEWFLKFMHEFKRIITDDGSIVIDFGSAYTPGKPVKSLYQYEILIRACKEVGLHLAQEFFHYNPARLPVPAQWVNVKKIRVKDSVNLVWWFSKTDAPKANNKNVLQPYSKAMEDLLKKGYRAKTRPSGHIITNKFNKDNGGSIPSNLLTIANNDSSSKYMKAVKEIGKKSHPARFPIQFAEFFIKFLTDPGDIVYDPFSGSNTTGFTCEQMVRNWIASEILAEYAIDSAIRFEANSYPIKKSKPKVLVDG